MLISAADASLNLDGQVIHSLTLRLSIPLPLFCSGSKVASFKVKIDVAEAVKIMFNYFEPLNILLWGASVLLKTWTCACSVCSDFTRLK